MFLCRITVIVYVGMGEQCQWQRMQQQFNLNFMQKDGCIFAGLNAVEVTTTFQQLTARATLYTEITIQIILKNHTLFTCKHYFHLYAYYIVLMPNSLLYSCKCFHQQTFYFLPYTIYCSICTNACRADGLCHKRTSILSYISSLIVKKLRLTLAPTII